MDLRPHLTQIALVIGAVLLSVGIQTFAAFSEPSAAPPSGNAYAPLTTSGTAESKIGGLLLNTGGAPWGLVVQSGNVGIDTTNPEAPLQIGGYMSLGSGVDYMGVIGFNRNEPTGAIYNTNYAAYQIQNNDGTLDFQIYSPTGALVSTNVMNSSGNVGIGTVNPGAPLQINQTNSGIALGNAAIRIENPSGSQSMLYFSSAGVQKASLRADSSGNLVLNAASGNIYLNNDFGGTPTIVVPSGGLNFTGGGLCLGGSCITSWPTSNGGVANSLAYQGNIAAENNTNEPAGLTFRGVYNNGYPTTYGNLISLGGGGGGQILIGWSGTTGGTADNYIRSRRDVSSTWSSWAKIITDQNIGSQSVNYANSVNCGNALCWNSWNYGNYYQTNGDIYMGWAGNWLSTVLSQKYSASNPPPAQTVTPVSYSTSVNVSQGQYAGVTASCGAGGVIMYGGCSDGSSGGYLLSSVPSGNTGWSCSYYAQRSGNIIAVAACTK